MTEEVQFNAVRPPARPRDRMALWVRKCVLSLVFAGSLSASGAGAILDDFDDDITDPSLWTIVNQGAGVTVQEINQRVEVEMAADANGAIFWGGYQTIGIYGGDLDVSVSYRLLDWPVRNGVRVGLALVSPEASQSFWTMERVSGGWVEQFGDAFLTDYNASLGVVVSTTDTAGALRIARTGNTISAWYWSNGDWQLIRSELVSSGDLRFEFAAWSHDPYFSHQRVRVAFDDVEAVPEPSTTLLLGAGVAVIGAGYRRVGRP